MECYYHGGHIRGSVIVPFKPCVYLTCLNTFLDSCNLIGIYSPIVACDWIDVFSLHSNLSAPPTAGFAKKMWIIKKTLGWIFLNWIECLWIILMRYRFENIVLRNSLSCLYNRLYISHLKHIFIIAVVLNARAFQAAFVSSLWVLILMGVFLHKYNVHGSVVMTILLL